MDGKSNKGFMLSEEEMIEAGIEIPENQSVQNEEPVTETTGDQSN